MSVSISEAARIWRVSRTTIYRKRRNGEVSFQETVPATIDPKEMRRVFGEPAVEVPPLSVSIVNATQVASHPTRESTVVQDEQFERAPIDACLRTVGDQRQQDSGVETIALAAMPSRPGLRASWWPLGVLR